jgi:hypothetical protein
MGAVGMTDKTRVGEERADPDAEDAESSRPEPDDDQDIDLAPTQNGRKWPSALDLARAFD